VPPHYECRYGEENRRGKGDAQQGQPSFQEHSLQSSAPHPRAYRGAAMRTIRSFRSAISLDRRCKGSAARGREHVARPDRLTASRLRKGSCAAAFARRGDFLVSNFHPGLIAGNLA
jgi:hypothetical protein